MINPFLLSAQDRLSHWKNFRKELISYDEQEQLQRVAEYWSHTPLQKIAYNIDEPETWPTPWEMMTINDWCRNSVAIGMDFTLRLSGWCPSRLKLKLILDRQTSVMGLMSIIDENVMLNYDWGMLKPYNNVGVILKTYQWNGKQYMPS